MKVKSLLLLSLVLNKQLLEQAQQDRGSKTQQLLLLEKGCVFGLVPCRSGPLPTL